MKIKFFCIFLLIVLFSCAYNQDQIDDAVKSKSKNVVIYKTTDTVYGMYTRVIFQIGNYTGYIIQPRNMHAYGQWIIYAPSFMGSNPGSVQEWYFTNLLWNGVAIAGIDVGESYGSQKGTEAYYELYCYIIKNYNFCKKVGLMPQSRGGLMLYNFAYQYPQLVKSIWGIYPVCDLRTYPGIETTAITYGMTVAELESKLEQYNPIDQIYSLIKYDIPIFHIHGDSDTIVPLETNSLELITRYQSVGGKATLKVIVGKGHEECPEFFHDQDFIFYLFRSLGY